RHDQVDAAQKGIRVAVVEAGLAAVAGEARPRLGRRVGDDDGSAARLEEAVDRATGAPCAQDQHVVARPVHLRSYLSLRVLSAASAQMIERIQKRTMICGSGHPRNSKWWWIGAMRKMRFWRSR